MEIKKLNNEEFELETSRLEKLNQFFAGEVFGVKKVILGGFLLIVLAGVGSGYLLAMSRGEGETLRAGKESRIKKGMEVGLKDSETFRDKAVGVIEKGGIEGEGSHKLIREGGPSQTAYLTSSIVNLDDFVGRKVEIWGETYKGQKAGWLMDVGRVKVLE